MNIDDPNYGDDFHSCGDMISQCCGAPSLMDIDDYNCGICSRCKEHAEFEKDTEE